MTTVNGTLTDNGSAMGGPPGELLRLLMRCDPSAPRLAREALRTVAAIDLVRSDAVLVASELVSNAVMHAGCEPGEEIELVVEKRSNAVRLAITDRGCSEKAPIVRGLEYRGPGGLGLRIWTRWRSAGESKGALAPSCGLSSRSTPPREQIGTGLKGPPPAQRSQPAGPAPRMGP